METQPPIVIHALASRPGWIEDLRQAFPSGREIVLLAPELDPARLHEVNRLAQQHQYHSPVHPPEAQWPDYKTKLKLTDLGAKEQGINPNLVYLLRPTAQPFPGPGSGSPRGTA